MKKEIWNWTAYLWDCLEILKTYSLTNNNMEEIWKDIPWFEWEYQCSNLWNILNVKKNKLRKIDYNEWRKVAQINLKRTWNRRIKKIMQQLFNIQWDSTNKYIQNIDWNYKNNRLDNLCYKSMSEIVLESFESKR